MRSYIAYVLGVVAVVVLTSATGFYFAEIGTNQNVDGFGDAVWWAIVTVTTIGYGDIYPVTVLGRIVGGFLIFAGIGTLSLVTAATAAYLIQIGGLDALRARRISTTWSSAASATSAAFRTGLQPRGIPGPCR
jgi:voltage-gated potassium channel